MPDIYRQGIVLRPVAELQPGDRVDLFCDQVADPCGWQAAIAPEEPGAGSEYPELEYEYLVVEKVERETTDCVHVDLSGSGGEYCFAFPADHLVEVDPEQERNIHEEGHQP